MLPEDQTQLDEKVDNHMVQNMRTSYTNLTDHTKKDSIKHFRQNLVFKYIG